MEGRSGNTHHALWSFIFSAVRGFGVGSREQLAAGRLKATTAEKIGIIGQNKAIAVQSLVNLK